MEVAARFGAGLAAGTKSLAAFGGSGSEDPRTQRDRKRPATASASGSEDPRTQWPATSMRVNAEQTRR